MVGWGNPVRINGWAPDGRWFGDVPRVLIDVRGAAAQAADPAGAGARSKTTATATTATTASGRARTATPSSPPCCAPCRSWRHAAAERRRPRLPRWPYAGLTDSGTGVELSLWGLLGFKLGWVEGVELNLLGLVAGLDLRHPAVKLPGFGRVGSTTAPRSPRLPPPDNGCSHYSHELSDGASARRDRDRCACASLPARTDGLPLMRDTCRCSKQIPFPPIRRGRLDTLQVNVGYRCNQSCVHCHVNAEPQPHRGDGGRRRRPRAGLPGAPAHRHARHHRRRAGAQSAFPPAGDRRARRSASASWTAATSPSWKSRVRRIWPNSSRDQQVEIVASMPCYLEDNVDRQRGKGVFDGSIRGLQRLNALGYGRDGSGLVLNLVYNPQGPVAAAAAGRARSRLQARARRATTASCSTSSTRSPTCRSSASARC